MIPSTLRHFRDRFLGDRALKPVADPVGSAQQEWASLDIDPQLAPANDERAAEYVEVADLAAARTSQEQCFVAPSEAVIIAAAATLPQVMPEAQVAAPAPASPEHGSAVAWEQQLDQFIHELELEALPAALMPPAATQPEIDEEMGLSIVGFACDVLEHGMTFAQASLPARAEPAIERSPHPERAEFEGFAPRLKAETMPSLFFASRPVTRARSGDVTANATYFDGLMSTRTWTSNDSAGPRFTAALRADDTYRLSSATATSPALA